MPYCGCHASGSGNGPGALTNYSQISAAKTRIRQVIVAGAGGAAHLPGMVAAHTVLPVIGVPVQSAALNGLDSLLSIVQMPKGVPVATVAIGAAGATNAGLLYTAKGTAAVFGGPLAAYVVSMSGGWESVFWVSAAMDLAAAIMAVTVLKALRASHYAASLAGQPQAAE